MVKDYIESRGARKTAVARVRLIKQPGIIVNGMDYKEYFKAPRYRLSVEAPLLLVNLDKKTGFSVKVKGGGVTGQAEAVRHGIARALIVLNIEFRKKLKQAGFLTRDPRMVERKKYGLKKARRAPQWAKR